VIKNSIVQRLDRHALVPDLAAGVVALQGDGAVLQESPRMLRRLVIGWLRPLVDLLAIDLQDHVISLDNDLVQEPFIILVVRIFNIDDVVETARLFPVAMSGIDLRLKALVRPVGLLIFRVEINAGVGMREKSSLPP